MDLVLGKPPKKAFSHQFRARNKVDRRLVASFVFPPSAESSSHPNSAKRTAGPSPEWVMEARNLTTSIRCGFGSSNCFHMRNTDWSFFGGFPGTTPLTPKQKPYFRYPECSFSIISVHFVFYVPGTDDLLFSARIESMFPIRSQSLISFLILARVTTANVSTVVPTSRCPP